jgi:hypothetical protein
MKWKKKFTLILTHYNGLIWETNYRSRWLNNLKSYKLSKMNVILTFGIVTRLTKELQKIVCSCVNFAFAKIGPPHHTFHLATSLAPSTIFSPPPQISFHMSLPPHEWVLPTLLICSWCAKFQSFTNPICHASNPILIS